MLKVARPSKVELHILIHVFFLSVCFDNLEQVPKSLKVLHKLNNSHPFVRFVGHENAFFSIGDVWKAQRRILNPAFRRTIPVALFGKLTQKAFEKIDAEPKGSPAAIVQMFDRMMLDMLALGLYCKFSVQPLHKCSILWIIIAYI